ncbi:hypothetical protein ES703_06873 [subsurface metagenome]
MGIESMGFDLRGNDLLWERSRCDLIRPVMRAETT